MSLILDALKKSDNERKTRIAPDMADVPEARRNPGPPAWLWWFVALLVINLAVLVFVLTRPDAPPPAASVAPAASPPTAAPANTTIAPPPAKQAVESLAAAAVPPRPAPVASSPPAANTAPTPGAVATPTVVESRPAPVVQTAPPPAPAEDLPLLATLRAEGRITLAELNIDLHVFNATASQRFVFVNGKRYNEGDTLADGPTVREIRRDGIVLAYRGSVFLLPRE